MDNQGLLRHFELAAQTVQAAPNQVSQQQRSAAEQVFLTLRQADDPFETCKFIIENTTVDYVLYEAVTAVKECVMRKWNSLGLDFIDGWRTYLLTLATTNERTPVFVRHRIVEAIAVFLKRGWLNASDNGASKSALFSQIWRLLSGNDARLQKLACTLLLEIMEQFATSSKASDVGLTWEFHDQCKRSFEQGELRSIFEACANLLASAASGGGGAADASILGAFIAMSERVLTWEFATGRVRRVGTFAGDGVASGTGPFRPPDSWRATVLNPSLLSAFFTTHEALRASGRSPDDPTYGQCGQCLVQLCSLAGAAVESETHAHAYIGVLVPLVARAVTMRAPSSLQGPELLWLGSLTSTLLCSHPLRHLVAVGAQHLDGVLMAMSAGACACMDPRFPPDEEEASWRVEALDQFLAGFVSVRSGAHADASMRASADERLRSFVGPVFEAYLTWRATKHGGDCDDSIGGDDEEVCLDAETDDWVLHEDQLCDIASIARADIAKSLSCIAGALAARSERVNQWMSGALGDDERTALFEELHWILMTAGHVMADADDGEKPCVPEEVLLLALSSGGDPSRDPVVMCSQSLLGVAQAEAVVVGGGDVSRASPRLARTVVWLLRRWAATYLMAEEGVSMQQSTQAPSLIVAYGGDSVGGVATLEFVARKVAQNMVFWRGEPDVCRDSADLLLAVARSSTHAKQAFAASPSVRELVRMLADARSAVRSLPPKFQCNVVRALAKIAFEGGYFGEISQNISSRFSSAIGAADFARRSQDPVVVGELAACLEGMRGIVLATESRMAPAVLDFLRPHLVALPALMDVYRNCPDVYAFILDLAGDAVGSLIALVPDADCHMLYDCSLRLLETHHRNTVGRTSVLPGDEEERHDDLVRLLKLLTSIIKKDFVDFADDGTSFGGEVRVIGTPGSGPQVSDVVLFGLGILLPLLGGDILRYPDLCGQFYSLVQFVCDVYPERVAAMPPAFLQQFAHAIAEGLSADATSVAAECLASIAELAAHRYGIGNGSCRSRDSSPESLEGQARALDGILPHFLSGIVEMLLLHKFDMDLLEPSSEALFALVCSYPAHFSALAENHVRVVADEALRGRFATACGALMSANEVRGVLDRTNKAKFRKNLEAFLMDVRGFLRRK